MWSLNFSLELFVEGDEAIVWLFEVSFVQIVGVTIGSIVVLVIFYYKIPIIT
jgi:hypothetical protein